MKNLFFAAVAMMMVGALASCTKTQTKTADPGSGMITLELEVNNDRTNYDAAGYTIMEKIPAGTAIQFVMNTGDYQEDSANYAYNTKTWTATVDADGMVSIALPAISKEAEVTVRFPELLLTKTTQTGTSGSISDPLRNVTESIVYEKEDETYTIYDGADVRALHLTYTEK